MLETPLGKLMLQKNNVAINYSVIPQKLMVIEKSNYLVDGRYLLKFDLNTIKEGDIIKCFIDNNNLNSDIDCGELLALINLRDNDIVLSIGAYDVSDEYYGRVQEKFAYEIRYLINGLEIEFIDLNYIEKCRIAISWMNVKENGDDIATWYASDPDLCEELY